jgi:hypothetical protein
MKPTTSARLCSLLAAFAISSSAWAFFDEDHLACKAAGTTFTVLCGQSSSCTGTGACNYCQGVTDGQQKICVTVQQVSTCVIGTPGAHNCGTRYDGTCTDGSCGGGSTGGPCSSVFDECQ